MALLNKGTSAIYLAIVSGKIAQRKKEPSSTTTTRTTDEGKIIHEEIYSSVEGMITDIGFKDGDYGKQLLVTIESDGDKAILQMPFSSGTASSFIKALPNVDLTKPVKLSPKMEEKDGKKKTVLFVNQDGKAAKWFWTKDNPGELPPMKKIKIKGKESWDDSDQLEYFETFIKEEILPKLGQLPTPASSVTEDEDAPF
jgi:hypothetical protein